MTTPADLRQVVPELEAESELLSREPPPQAVRVFTDVVLGLFLVAAAFVGLVHVPSAAHGRFELRPVGGAAPIDAPWPAVVEGIEVRLGDEVISGQTLFFLRSEDVRRQAAEHDDLVAEALILRQQLAGLGGVESGEGGATGELGARITRLRRELAAESFLRTEQERHHALLAETAQARIARWDAELRARQERLASLETLHEMAERSHAAGVSPRRDVLESSQRVADGRADAAEAQGERDGARADAAEVESQRHVALAERDAARTRLTGELNETEAALAERRGELEARREGALSRLDALSRALRNTSGDRLAVRAPCSGTVAALPVERVGATVARGQRLCDIAPAGAVLEAYIVVPEAEAGRLAVGQPVRFLLDAYPHTLHGAKEGRLTWISPTARSGDLEAVANLPDPTIRVERQRVALRAGLTGEARVRTGSVSLLQYALAPLRQVRENVAPSAVPRPGEQPVGIFQRFRQFGEGKPAPPGEAAQAAPDTPEARTEAPTEAEAPAP